jgi:hypothetical protein
MHFLSSDFHTTSARKTKCSAFCQKYFGLSCEKINVTVLLVFLVFATCNNRVQQPKSLILRLKKELWFVQ